jgi:hypothetical protein
MKAKTQRRDTFAADREKRQITREEFIGTCLKRISKSKISFDCIFHLAKFLAPQVNEALGTKCSPGTLLRNPRYRVLLSEHQLVHRPPGVGLLPETVVETPAGRAVLDRHKLELMNLRRENERLKAFIAQRGDQLMLPTKTQTSAQSSDSFQHFEERFVLTCQALRSLISHAGDVHSVVYRVNPDLKRIEAGRTSRPEVVVDRRLAEPFLDWLKSLN